MNGVQTRFKCKLDVKRCKRFVFPPSSLLPRSNALKTKAIRYFQTDRTLTRIVSPPLHAIFVDAPKVLTHVPKEEFPAQTLTVELYLEAGIRGCEIGYLLADRDPVTRENRFNGLDLLRLAIPRRVYTDNHMNVIAAALKNVYDRRETITRGVRITWEAPLMRHFTVQLERL